MAVLDVKFELENIAPGGHVGLIALATDYNSESDLRRILPKGVEVFTNRVLNANPVTIENLRAMSGDITRAAAGILPGHGVDVMIYGCTSGTAAIGETEVNAKIQAAQPGIPCTNPIAAASVALQAFGARKISVLTPYTDSVNIELAERFRERGFQILNIDGFGMEDDIEMTRLPLVAISEGAMQVCDPNADALFISCTAIRAAAVAQDLESRLKKPVITSNQALAWHCLRLLNDDFSVSGYGSLFGLSPNGSPL